MMKFLHAATLFFTLGLALAKEFFTQLGFHADPILMGVVGNPPGDRHVLVEWLV